MTDRRYVVRLTTTVDAPEKRSDTFAKVAPGTVSHWSSDYTRQRSAVAMFDEVMAGEYDFGSEYVSLVVVLAMRPGRSPRLVRRYRRRARVDGRVVEVEYN